MRARRMSHHNDFLGVGPVLGTRLVGVEQSVLDLSRQVREVAIHVAYRIKIWNHHMAPHLMEPMRLQGIVLGRA